MLANLAAVTMRLQNFRQWILRVVSKTNTKLQAWTSEVPLDEIQMLNRGAWKMKAEMNDMGDIQKHCPNTQKWK